MRKSLIAGIAVLALSFGMVACGGSDDSSSDSSSSSSSEGLTNAELIKEGDALCTKFDGEVAVAFQDAGLKEGSTQADFEAFVTDEIVPLYREQIEEFRQITPNEEDADDWNAIVNSLETELDAVEENPESALGDTTPFPDSTAAAKDFGLKVCGAD